MKNYWKWFLIATSFSLFFLLDFTVYGQATYPYANGQAVFVQSPYTSSLYTNYVYDANGNRSNRLPTYTTNSSVFVQQPYATAQQTVAAYPSVGQYNLPYKESRYASPIAYPSTVAPAYPFATVRSYTSSPYITTNQYPTSTYPNQTQTFTTTDTYPYVTRQVGSSSPTIVQQTTATPYSSYPTLVPPAAQYASPVNPGAPMPTTVIQQPSSTNPYVTTNARYVTYPTTTINGP